MTLTLTDLFCGAGGSSSGAIQVPSVRVRTAVNHWKLAVETHNTNHPDTDHTCADISQVDPRRFPRTDILWASPECTNHSIAKSRKPDAQPDLFGDRLPDEAAERSRATMWDVPRFAEHHRYEAIIVENVVDAVKWVMFPAWLQAMDLLGYNHETVYLNSMHAHAGGAPAPQSRDRAYVVFWREGNRAPNFAKWTRPHAWCAKCATDITALQGWKNPDVRWGRYRQQYVWRCPKVSCRNSVVEPGWLAAATAIDWSLPGTRIGDRTKPLSPKTMARISAGLRKFAASFGSAADLTASPIVDAPGGHQEALLVPVEGRDGKEARSAREPMRTMTTRNETGLLVPYYGTGVAQLTIEPHRTFTTRDRYAFVVPLRNHNTPKAVSEPYDTFAASGNHHGLATANIPDIEDCSFRMLEPYEIAAGMAFASGYKILGNKREQTRQLETQ
ncbi:DNA cytosine methyltransferase [Aldersonia sp. NBC_00410]|uniref:DNA cytosine methyltransferase n=1 Tax=Aldersonia sp. NBC_00410 TaxID=2975954 RepID=UPI002253C4FE|nr:DNA cytosine methyltransferase [Aldersonia sp. NBC_00410]MCX5042481.1 DNA cytosine methyltransferase [Aldersonia sp. NBC_00410]